MIRLIPVAIAKNDAIEGRSRMGEKEFKSTLQHEPGPAPCLLFFAIIRWPVPKKKAPLPVERDATDIS
jgi:hypothetical protein